MIKISKSTVYERCSLCFSKDDKHGDNLIWMDGLQLCEKCHSRYIESPYNQRCMLLNSITCYRKLIDKYENNGNIKIDVKFDGIS